jgi:hypothetical protein
MWGCRSPMRISGRASENHLKEDRVATRVPPDSLRGAQGYPSHKLFNFFDQNFGRLALGDEGVGKL